MRAEDIRISEYVSSRRRRKLWQQAVKVMACVVVFCTVYALILPAITQEREVFCGQEPHTHSDACYTEEYQASALACTYGSLGIHTHGADCYGESGTLICDLADYVVHTHDTSCLDAEGNLVCTLPEIDAHVHDESCYVTVQEGHAHTDTCYTLECGDLVCTLEETEGHIHDDSCRTSVLICQTAESEEHTHTDACYQTELVCGLEESEGHAHTDACFAWNEVLACTKPECEAVTELVCTITQEQVHIHTESCFQDVTATVLACTLEEHEHSLACYSDPTADTETAALWEKTFAGANLTGIWVQDAVTIAKTQLGYAESSNNYIVLEDGETTRGYTRYGAWYGNPYDDWDAMFVSFCLYYAGVEEMPLAADCAVWVDALTESGLYQPQGSYIPEVSDLVFFDTDGDGSADRVGIIAELTADESTGILQLQTVEGNYSNQVKANTYSMDSASILGYGQLPNQLTEEQQSGVDSVIAIIDAIPSADEIDAKLAEFEAAEDYEGEAAWYTDTVEQICEAYMYYSHLSDVQKAAVTNADKLLELEYIWSVSTYYVTTDSFVNDAPTVVQSASTSEFIDLNIYDYGSNINDLYTSTQTISYVGYNSVTKYTSKYPGFQWNGGAYVKYSNGTALYDRHAIDYIDFGNSMITDMSYSGSSNKKSTTATDITINKIYYYNINSMDVEASTYGVTNRPIGMSLASSITDTSRDVLLRTLGSDGYPALTDGTSLSYLFKDGTYADQKNTQSIDGLFQQNATTGEYYYNSRWNHAQYSNNRFTLYAQIITPNFITYPFGNFLPFNDITDSSTSTQVSKLSYAGGMGDYVQGVINDLWYDSNYRNQSSGIWSNATASQLVDMLGKYRTELKGITVGSSTAWETWTASDAINDYFKGDSSDTNDDHPSDDTSQIDSTLLAKMYNIDWDVKTNFFFGMEMTMYFMQPKGGMTGNDTNNDGASDYPMQFYFTGDDDVWVYIDGVLFLDLSGIHRHVGGEIDFVNGKVHYYYLDTANTGDVSTEPYQTFTFAEILSAAGASTDCLNSNGTFTDYTTHQFKFYYMERGSGSSVCRLNFNFPLLRQNSISVSKAVSSDTEILGNPDYSFQVLKADSSGNKTSELFIAAGTQYTIYDENDNVIGTGTTDANGVFTLKAGQRAEFTGIQENAGKYYVRELLDGTVLGQYGNVTVSGESTTTSNNVTVGSETFTGMDSPVKDMSDGATAFRFTNDVDENKLGSLQISKVLAEYSLARTVKYFDVQVTLDGQLLPVGTTYTVGTETRTVTTAGIVTIAADETAVIADILAGTAFTVQETSGSAEGYTVTYSDSGGYSITVNDGVVSGVIKTSASVQLVVTNAEKGASVTIPGTKYLVNPDGTAHSFTFTLTEVTDSTGSTVRDGGLSGYEATATVTGTETAAFSFTINYVQVEQTTLPAVFYYRIVENGEEHSLPNETDYVVEVTVSEADDGISAAITGMWKDGEEMSSYSADFVNTLASSLTIEKKVDGGTAAQSQSFTFTVKLTGDHLPASFPAVFYQQDGTTESKTLYLNENGEIVLYGFMHGEKAVISGIPYGTTWTVTESDNDGFIVTTVVTAGETSQSGAGSTASGTVPLDPVQVVYTNAASYALPETGGAGTTPYAMTGLALMAAALCLLYRTRKRRKGGKYS